MLTSFPRSSLCAPRRFLSIPVLVRHLQTSSTSLAAEKDGTSRRTTGQRAISLLEELFPRRATWKSAETKKKPERHVPKLPLDVESSSEEFIVHNMGSGEANTDRALERHQRHRHNRETALLVLRKASKFLIESDFRRAAPSAKHIEGWTFKGDILKVISGRDQQTLERNGVYYLVFENPVSAQAYRDHVMQLHRYCQSQLPQGLTGPIPPPPSIDASGKISYGPMETYTLIPPSQALDLRMMIQPFSPLLREVIDNFGYVPLVDGKKSNHEVLLTVHWMLLSLGSVKRALKRDGENRGCAWATIEALAKGTSLRHVRERLDLLSKSEESKPESYGRTPRRHGKKRYIVSFKDDAEAKRFALSWNRREISDLLDDDLAMRGQEIMAEAELL